MDKGPLHFGGRELIFHEAKQNNAGGVGGGGGASSMKTNAVQTQIACHKEFEPVWEKLQKECISQMSTNYC